MRIAPFVRGFLLAFILASVWAGAQATKPAPAASARQAATAFYLGYRAAYDKAAVFEEILPYWSASKRQEAEGMPAIVRGQGFGIMKSANPLTGVTVVKEETTAEGATLTVEGIRPDQSKRTGVVTLVRESGAWKVAAERWR